MKFRVILLIVCLFCLLHNSMLLSQESIYQMKVTGKSGILLTADKGKDAGIEKDWMYDMKRIVVKDTFHVGTAVVHKIEANICYLKPFFVKPFRPQMGDVLIKNDALTESLQRTKAFDFWDEIQGRYTGVDEMSFIDGIYFENCRIIMKNGDHIKVKSLIVKSDKGILVPQKYTKERELVPIEGIESIKTSTENYALFGAIIGGAIGGAAILMLHEDKIESDTTYYYVNSLNQYGNIIGWSKMMKIVKKDHRLPMLTRIGLVGGGYLMGSLIGYAFKGRWREIYKSEKPNSTMSLNWSVSQPLPDGIGINLNLRF